ncbi:MAG TPA: C4-type zinc ribbon domain-containing protein [Candidatus Polarisedimenticolia bacterium]|nr:C4-type zinc ribbon domain-containing protein [Candidatus Polarisedimenticolia bacterium]
MDPVLLSLIRYQELSLELSRLDSRLQQFPERIAAIDAGLKASAGSLDSARAAIADHQKERRKLEGELQDLEAKLKKYNDQLMQVKTNDEYRAMQHEIDGVKEKIDGVEEKILILMEDADSADRRVMEEERLLEGKKREAEALRQAVGREEAAVREEHGLAAAAQAEARGALGPDVLELFARIAGGRNGVAMARAAGERCQGCKVRLRPQVYQEIKRNDTLIQCDSCKRILYYLPETTAESDAGPGDTPAPAAPDPTDSAA